MEDLITYWAALGTLGGMLALAAAVFVFRTAPNRQVAWRFGGLLVLETIMVWTSGAGPLFWVDKAGVPAFWMKIHIANDGLLVAVYLPALAVTIRSRLLAPFGHTSVALGMLGIGLLNGVLVFLIPDLYIDSEVLIFNQNSVGDSSGAAWGAIFALLVASYVFGLIAILAARRSALGRLEKRKATLLAIAFGVRDLTWGVMYAIGLYAVAFGMPEQFANSVGLSAAVSSVGLVAYVCLTAYGIASSDLFDIDLKIKWTLERGTIAAIFIAVFFMVSEGTSAFLSERLGSLVGIVATGALVFALAPLQRAAERLSSQAMPSVRDTPEYRSYRKLQIYGEALSGAMRDGEISPIERVILNRLRANLELDDAEVEALEQEFGDVNAA